MVVMFLTLVGNSTLILAIMCHKKERRKRVNIFLVNLACGDLGENRLFFSYGSYLSRLCILYNSLTWFYFQLSTLL